MTLEILEITKTGIDSSMKGKFIKDKKKKESLKIFDYLEIERIL